MTKKQKNLLTRVIAAGLMMLLLVLLPLLKKQAKLLLYSLQQVLTKSQFLKKCVL